MQQRMFVRFVLVIAGVALAAAADASTIAGLSKLDHRARVALEGLRSGMTVDALRERRASVSDDGALDVFVVGGSRAELEAAGARVRTSHGGISTAHVPIGSVDQVASLASVTSIRGAVTLEPELDQSARLTEVSLQRGPGPDFAGINGEGVMVGMVDSGIYFDHGDFKDPSGKTRVVAIWDQAFGFGTPPLEYGYGTLWSAADIDSGICTETDGNGHGTGVMGVAAGDGSQYGGGYPFVHVGMAPKADIAVVKSDLTDTGLIDGVQWLFDLAKGRGQPIVVDVSIGTQAGSHDGTDPAEGLLSQMSGPGCIVVKSAGNDRSSGRHAETYVTPEQGGTIDFNVPFMGGQYRFISIEGYYTSGSNLTVMLIPPGGLSPIVVPYGTRDAVWPGVDTGAGYVYLENGLAQAVNGDPEVYIEINAYYFDRPIGLWQVRFSSSSDVPAQVDVWRTSIGGDQPIFNKGQSNRMLISEPGNAERVITVGAWISREQWTGCNGVTSDFFSTPAGSLALFSSPGPTRDGRMKPDLSAPGSAILTTISFDQIRSCPSPPDETRYGDDDLNHIADWGTSLSAPHVAGAVALLLQRFGWLTPEEVKEYLFTHARTDGFTGIAWNPDWGWGKLDIGDLVPPTVRVVKPNGYEIYLAGQVATVEWAAVDSFGVSSVDIQVSRTGRLGPWEIAATGLPNTGSFNWVVTEPGTGQAWIRVVARDASGNAGDDRSDARFRITTITGVEPAGGTLAFGIASVGPSPARGPARIDYVVARAAPVRLTVLDLQGRQVEVLATGARAAGRYQAQWPPPGSSVPAGLYFVRYDYPGGSDLRRVVLVH
jgi:hypothetical protein